MTPPSSRRTRQAKAGLRTPFLAGPNVQELKPSSVHHWTKPAHEQWPLEGLAWTWRRPSCRTLRSTWSWRRRHHKNIYGSTTAPQGLWLSLHKTLAELGAPPVLRAKCLWTSSFPAALLFLVSWLAMWMTSAGSEIPTQECGARSGITSTKACKWGMVKTKAYRHAGTDVSTEKDQHVFDKIVVGRMTWRFSPSWRLRTRTSESASFGPRYMALVDRASPARTLHSPLSSRPFASRASSAPTAVAAMTRWGSIKVLFLVRMLSSVQTTCKLRWLVSDHDLADALTKKRGDARGAA